MPLMRMLQMIWYTGKETRNEHLLFIYRNLKICKKTCHKLKEKVLDIGGYCQKTCHKLKENKFNLEIINRASFCPIGQ